MCSGNVFDVEATMKFYLRTRSKPLKIHTGYDGFETIVMKLGREGREVCRTWAPSTRKFIRATRRWYGRVKVTAALLFSSTTTHIHQ
jgi:hypothetical protein